MYRVFFFFATCIALQAATIYQVNQTVGAGSVVGTITTDDTIGVLSGANITAWSLIISNGLLTAQLASTLPNHNVDVPGTTFSATATQRLFNYNGAPGSYVFFRDNSTNNFWCFQTSACTAAFPAESVQVQGTTVTEARSGSLVIANTTGGTAVPEPSTLGLVALSGSLLVLLRRSR